MQNQTLPYNKPGQPNMRFTTHSPVWTAQTLCDQEGHPDQRRPLSSSSPIISAAAIRQEVQSPTGPEEHLQKKTLIPSVLNILNTLK